MARTQHAAANLMSFVRPVAGTSPGLKALYKHVESETNFFRERFQFLLPRTPTSLSHTNHTVWDNAVKNAECAEALKHLHARMKTNSRRTEPITGVTQDEMDTILHANALLSEKQNVDVYG